MHVPAGQLVANNYLWACAEDKRTVICNPILYLSVKSANLAFLWGVSNWTDTEMRLPQTTDAFKIKCVTVQQ